MIRVLFVCLGNICRSPLAEGVFKDLIAKNNLNSKISCDSAGTAGYHIGSQPDHRSIKTALGHGITLNHLGKQLSIQDFEAFDYIIAMDKQNYEDIISLQKKSTHKSKVLIMREFDDIKDSLIVPDPYYGTMKDFENVYDIVLRSGINLLEFIKNEHKL